MPALPSGTVTFLASDLGDDPLADSTETRRTLRQRHTALIGDVIAAYGGAPFRAEGSTFFGAFASASVALTATLAARAGLATLADDDALKNRTRLVIQTTETAVAGSRYLPSSLRHVGRLLTAARGGQTLVGASTAELARRHLPPHLALRDLGEHQLADLSPAGRIYLLAEAAAPVDPRPIKSLDWHPHNLPAQVTPLIGRDTEQAEIDRMLRQPAVRLLSLTGPGGIGKTRLALHVAAGLVDAFDDGVFFVPLAAVAEPSQVLPKIARTIGVTPSETIDLREALAAFLAEREVLLIVDNVEHVIDAAGERDPYRLAVGHIGLEAVLRLFVEQEAQPSAFHALTRFLDLLDESEAELPAQPALEPLVLSFQLKLLWLSGYLPHLTSCAACGEAKPLVGFSARAGGAVCRECGIGAHPLSEAGFLGIRALLELPLAGAREADLGEEALRQCLRVITSSYEEHGGFRLRTLSA